MACNKIIKAAGFLKLNSGTLRFRKTTNLVRISSVMVLLWLVISLAWIASTFGEEYRYTSVIIACSPLHYSIDACCLLLAVGLHYQVNHALTKRLLEQEGLESKAINTMLSVWNKAKYSRFGFQFKFARHTTADDDEAFESTSNIKLVFSSSFKRKKRNKAAEAGSEDLVQSSNNAERKIKKTKEGKSSFWGSNEQKSAADDKGMNLDIPEMSSRSKDHNASNPKSEARMNLKMFSPIERSLNQSKQLSGKQNVSRGESQAQAASHNGQANFNISIKEGSEDGSYQQPRANLVSLAGSRNQTYRDPAELSEDRASHSSKLV